MSASAPERRLDETRSQTPAQPWKSGASAPRQDFRIMNRALAPETSIISSTRIWHSEAVVKPGEQPDVASRQTPQPRLPHFSRFFARSGTPQLSPSWDFDPRRINRESPHRASPHTRCHSESGCKPGEEPASHRHAHRVDLESRPGPHFFFSRGWEPPAILEAFPRQAHISTLIFSDGHNARISRRIRTP
jgi:hypothetical protein